MSAETGFVLDETEAPLRISGFIGLLMGVLSIFSIVAMPMLIAAVAAIAFGLFALRRWDSESRPVGTTPARIGILLAVLFGSAGIALPMTKQAMVGAQAEKFAKEYVRVIANGDLEYALELRKRFTNRYLASMPLQQFYLGSSDASQVMQEFREESLTGALQDLGPDAEWKVVQATRIFHHYGRNMAEVVMEAKTPPGANPMKIRVVMEYFFHPDDGAIEWHIDNCGYYRERIVAESVL
ncbi:hypothetical protein Pla52n_41040 [Stieleria varia]|uniref:Uncharacterized protein n=2 Tax=Stieleria varia TaxID=2528005 RepID=A0A5C6ASP2_9BACT|nr:hypothetical protein Pla52n_41040 [Stieleria varia]